MDEWKIKYEEMLEDINITLPEVIEYVKGHMPPKLFRYRKFDEHWKKNILERTIYLSKPKTFNDPYDTAVRISYDTLKSYFVHKNNNINNLKKKQIEQKIRKIIRDQDDILSENFKENLRVACFSNVNDSILMWSHYADFHKGFCIEYDTRKGSIFSNALPVIYKKERYDAAKCLVEHTNKTSITPILYKAKVWDYENEWRIIATDKHLSETNYILDMKNYITGIYLGAKAKEYDKDNNINAIQEWGESNNIPIYEMKLQNDEYKLI